MASSALFSGVVLWPRPKAMPRYLIQTFGCQMNAHDSARMAEVLHGAGFTEASDVGDADLIVFNTCSVREHAEQKLRSEAGKLAPEKRARPDLVIAVAGCVAQQEGEALLTSIAHIDLVIGPDNIPELPRLFRDQSLGAPPIARTVFDVDSPQFLTAPPAPGAAPVSAYVTTMKGCDERCSFCVVPYTRGPERYRPSEEILAEIESLVRAGTKEVTLLGQTVDSYRDPLLPPPASQDPDESQFPGLLRAIAERVPALARLRYTSPHPRHLVPSLVRAHAELPVLARHVHMPVQSGSDRVLKRMIRRYTRAEYIDRVTSLKNAVPGLTLSTDIIVGFPGETDDDFEKTLTLVAEVGFTSLFGFKYSVRPHTPARKLADDVPEDVKSERLARLFALAESQGKAHLETLVGGKQRVLVEADSKSQRADRPRSVTGRTERHEIVHLAPPSGKRIVGEIVECEITRAFKHSLEGKLDETAIARLPDGHNPVEKKRRPRSLPIAPPEGGAGPLAV
jgi:tRNA-2-methylthio-N6-dimethylallyladenosine synthase